MKGKQIKPDEPVPAKSKIEFADGGDVFSDNRLYNLPLSIIEPSPFDSQGERRKRFTTEKLLELGESIALNGLIEPITVRECRANNSHYFEIVCGERRWRASQLKELGTINCFIRDLSDAAVLVLQYEENHQQQPNAPMDDALTFKLLHEKEGLSEKEIADRLGTSRHNVVEKLKLNDLISEAVAELEAGSLLLKHAYYLAKFPESTQREIVRAKYAYKYNDAEEKAVSFEEFKREVEANVVRRLTDAPFDVNDERLHIKGLTCPNCPESTAFERHLFPDLAKDDSCLNSVCFRLKTDTHLKLKRDEIAALLPNPENKPIEEMVKSVPLVTSNSYEPTRSPFGKEKILTSVQPLPEPECEFSKPSLAAGGEQKGKHVYSCREKHCPVHDPQPAKTLDKSEIANDARLEIFRQAMEWFDDYKSFWQFDDLIRTLIVKSLMETVNAPSQDKILRLVKNWKAAPPHFVNKTLVEKFVADLDKKQQSQILFLLTYEVELYTFRSDSRSDETIRAIAKDYTKLDYDELTAEIREMMK